MHISQILHVVAILAGTISHVTGALTQEQIIDAIDVLTIMVNTANSDANSLTPATADPNVQIIVNNNKGIVAQINEDNAALKGTATLSTSGQQAVASAFNQYSNAVIGYANTLGGQAKDFSVAIDLDKILRSVEEIASTNEEFVELIEFIASDGTNAGSQAVQTAIKNAEADIDAALTAVTG